MIRITLELVSARGAARDRLLGVAYIANTGRATAGAPAGSNRYMYESWFSKTLPDQTQKAWKTGRSAIPDDQLITDQIAGDLVEFDRVRRGAWDLLYLCLKAVVGVRNG